SELPFGSLRRRGLLVSEVEGHQVHQQALDQNPLGFSRDFRTLLEWGANQPQSKIDAAYADIRAAGARFQTLMKGVDVLVLPTAPQGPFRFEAQTPANQADFTAIANMAGCPAVAVPATPNGAPPASIQFIAKPDGDHLALRAAAIFEAKRGPAPRPPAYF
ncbi:MAG: amidase family protein, partial [Pseudomonadota bacterium]